MDRENKIKTPRSRRQKQRRTTFQATAPKIEKPVRLDAPIISGVNINLPQSPPRVEIPASPSKPVVERSETRPIDLKLAPEVAQRMEERRIQMTFTPEEILQRRHKRELASQSIFQFYAELQLYKRYIDGSRKKKRYNRTAATPVIQHQINLTLRRFNVNTFRSVLYEILDLGVEDEVFVLSFVNVIFKQAVLNPTLAVLFSQLADSVIHVLKHSRLGELMRTMFKERVDEAFVAPGPDTDRGTVILMKGVLVFAAHLYADHILNDQQMTKIIGELSRKGTEESASLLVDFFAIRTETIEGKFKNEFAALRTQIANYPSLTERFSKIDTAVPPPTKEVRFMPNDPSISHSPSFEPELDAAYPRLFKRSDSIPMELSALADDAEDSLQTVTQNYLHSADITEVISLLEQMDYKREDQKTANDLVKAITEETEENQIVVSKLSVDALKAGLFTTAQLKAAIKTLTHNNPADEAICSSLVRIHALMISDGYANFDEFEWLFSDCQQVWPVIIPRFLSEAESLRGTLIEDIQTSTFWKSLAFLPKMSFNEQLATLNTWDIIGFFPHLEAILQFSQNLGDQAAARGIFAITDTTLISSAIVAFLSELDEQSIQTALHTLAPFVQKNKRKLQEIARRLNSDKVLKQLK